MKNTCSLELNLNVDADDKKASLIVKTRIDGELKFIYTNHLFRGFSDDIIKVFNEAIVLIEKDGRFGC